MCVNIIACYAKLFQSFLTFNESVPLSTVKILGVFQFTEGVNSLNDLKPGMVLNGLVTNITAFGAFVDVGVHQDGLVHKSKIADTFVRDPADHVRLNQRVKVKVESIDKQRKRIQFTMAGVEQPKYAW